MKTTTIAIKTKPPTRPPTNTQVFPFEVTVVPLLLDELIVDVELPVDVDVEVEVEESVEVDVSGEVEGSVEVEVSVEVEGSLEEGAEATVQSPSEFGDPLEQ